MIGWIIYSAEDVEKNKHYIEMYKEKFNAYHINLELVIAEEKTTLKSLMGNYDNGREQPDFAINRSRFSKIAKDLEDVGVSVFNGSEVTRIVNNKGKTYEFFYDVVPFLPVRYEDKIIVSQIEDKGFSYPYVIKSNSGHGGSEVFMVENERQEQDAINVICGEKNGININAKKNNVKDSSISSNNKDNCININCQSDKYIMQQCCSDLGKDVRVYIIGNKIVKAVLRTSAESFKSNYSLGGKVEEYRLNDREKAMVNAIVQKLSLDYAGIDFTFHNGEAVFNEIEDAVGARMLYQVSDIDIVQLFVDYIVEKMRTLE